jgi:hypothetical protein
MNADPQLIVNATATDLPPGAGLITVTGADPAVAISEPGIKAVSVALSI